MYPHVRSELLLRTNFSMSFIFILIWSFTLSFFSFHFFLDFDVSQSLSLLLSSLHSYVFYTTFILSYSLSTFLTGFFPPLATWHCAWCNVHSILLSFSIFLISLLPTLTPWLYASCYIRHFSHSFNRSQSLSPSSWAKTSDIFLSLILRLIRKNFTLIRAIKLHFKNLEKTHSFGLYMLKEW